jgi:hypothetical protein
MTAVLLLDAGVPLIERLFPPMAADQQLQQTPILITAVLMGCIAAAYLALWRAAPDFRAFRSLGVFFATVAVSQSLDYFGGHTPYLSVRAIASGMLAGHCGSGQSTSLSRSRCGFRTCHTPPTGLCSSPKYCSLFWLSRV